MTFAVGSLVRARGREWVVLPSDDDELLRLRPLGGTEEDAVGLYLPLEGHQVSSATLPPPDPAQVGDFVSLSLLYNAARLGFRSATGPFRSLARIAVQPRPYQVVPLLMALRLDPVRLLIGDDVGIGKTIEAALIARELYDRGEIHRLAVLCPPHLCEQWQAELAEKFHLEAEVVRPGTVARLERGLPLNRSIFDEYRFVIVSIDYIKSDRRRTDFLRACPELVIVDEAHTCARPAADTGAQHQRHRLVADLAADRSRHLILLTGTPHSGDTHAFGSLIGLLNPSLGERLKEDETGTLTATERARLARHFVQRRRADIVRYLDTDTPFPRRVSREEPFSLSAEWVSFLDRVLAYATELVRGAEGASRFQQRVTWWAALALLRCAGSSPAAAAAALLTKAIRPESDDPAAVDRLAASAVLDLETNDETATDDAVPGADLIQDEGSSERRRLLALAREADALRGDRDPKLRRAIDLVRSLLDAGFRPIVFCRYIATAHYVAEELARRLPAVTMMAVTGELPSEERERRVLELAEHERRVLVATDCLSEGINLQNAFDAVVHYDLAWNPTRHEQREGRVDRFGQRRPEVRTAILYGQNNRVDGAVLRVLLKKAERIRTTLGVSVPVPIDSNAVLEAVFEALFLKRAPAQQLALDLDETEAQLEREWEAAAEREQRTRTIFAQHALRPEEVREEIAAAAAGAGATEVRRFVAEVAARFAVPLTEREDGVFLDLDRLPEAIALRADLPRRRLALAFDLPAPERALYVPRTHPLVESLASYLLDTAIADPATAIAKRAGAIRTRNVEVRTTLLLLRLRHRIFQTRGKAQTEMLAEECLVAGFTGRPSAPRWLASEEATRLLAAQPSGNLAAGQASHWVREVVDTLSALTPGLEAIARERADAALAAHRRVRDAAGISGLRFRVEPQLPVDLLGVFILVPVV